VEKRGEAVAWRGLLHLLLLPSLEVGSLFGEGEVQLFVEGNLLHLPQGQLHLPRLEEWLDLLHP
jgi:hypothetical protein